MYILNHKRQIRNVSFEQFFRLAKYYFPPDSWWILSRNKTDVSFKKNPPKKKILKKKIANKPYYTKHSKSQSARV